MRGLPQRSGSRGGGVATGRRTFAGRLLSRRVHADLAQVLIERPEQHDDSHHKQECRHERQEPWSTRKVSHVFYPSFVNYPASL